jgi:16S rRNA U516 pseudouridylate synthase RsuA-like enzyme
MCALCHLKLHRLVRVSEGKLTLGNLESGRWRYLTAEEIRYLQEEI